VERCASARARAARSGPGRRGKEGDVSKFQDYYDFTEPLKDIPSHRILAIRRGEAEGC
jgi:uncharacterized protein